jgi:MtfA peptidase
MPRLQSYILNVLFKSRDRRREHLMSVYSRILNTHFSYFIKLNEEEKKIFLYRIYRFIKSKDFRYIGLEENMEIEVLISASAVQLSFGLEKYKMGFFEDIYIMKDAYTYGSNQQPWAGHVNLKGIHISWHHFQHGYAIANDKYNGGLHEMAHALEYELAMGDYVDNELMQEHFKIVLAEIDKVILYEQLNRSSIFTDQGITNRHECWAESIEVFFENPMELKKHYSRLFDSIKIFLNQEPQC